MYRIALSLALVLPAASLTLKAQTTYSPSQTEAQSAPSDRVLPVNMLPKKKRVPPKPLSRIAVSVGVSPLGPGLQLATNLNKHFNVRGTGDFFTYSTNFTTNGISASAKMNLASAGASVDIFPFGGGFRISPGAIFYNQNRLTANATVPGGSSFTLSGNTFYSDATDPIAGTAYLGLHTTKPAFTATAGWGNMIPQSGGHWSFPFELGAAFIGAPALTANLGGTVCLQPGQYCYPFATAPEAQIARTDLQSQIVKWNSDLSPLKTYPIVSFGIAYNFKIR